MPANEINIFFNPGNARSEAFTSNLVADLNKCMSRFRLQADILLNQKSTPATHDLLVITADENDPAFYREKFSDTAKLSQALVLLTEPVADIPFDTSLISQPYIFFEKLFTTDEIRLLRKDDPATRSGYWEKVTDIVSHLESLIEKTDPESNRKSVFLSNVDIDQNADRENLKRDLVDLGYNVLPDKILSRDIGYCKEQVLEALEKVHMIIHIIPNAYYPYFNNQQISLAEHQCNISAEFIIPNPGKVKRILWISSMHEITDEENQIFVERIQRDPTQTTGSAVLKSSIEDLKKYYRHIHRSAEPTRHLINTPDVYFIMDPGSNGSSETLAHTIDKYKLNSEKNYQEITYNQHMNFLAAARSVVLLYSDENEQWLSVKINDILKSRGMDSFRPFEKIILMKQERKWHTDPYHERFTHVIHDIRELPALLSE